ncbi:MAG: hypothetical protein IT349_19225 [Candidatus Eisenbacteria bacterium]|nr:hypothetical protein [Candidatus Eisenbacteria bacterium]
MTTLVLNHFDGSDGATSFTDEVLGVSWTRLSSAELDTAYKKWSTASLRLPANTNSGARATGFSSPHAGNFTMEAWVLERAGGDPAGFELSAKDSSGNYAARIGVAYDSEGPEGAGFYLEIEIYNVSGGSSFLYDYKRITLSDDVFYHIALVRDNDGNFWDGFFNGVRVHHLSSSTDCLAIDRIECYNWQSLRDVHFDDVRLNDEISYSGATYTVPTTPFSIVTVEEALTGEEVSAEQGVLSAWFLGSSSLSFSASAALAPAEFAGSGALSFSGLAAQAVQGFAGQIDFGFSLSASMIRPDPLGVRGRGSWREIVADPDCLTRIVAKPSYQTIDAEPER